MNGNAPRAVRFGVGLVVLAALGWVLTSQAAKPAQRAVALPTDWSHQHLIFSKPGTAERAVRVAQDPRYQQQWYRRNTHPMAPQVSDLEARIGDAMRKWRGSHRRKSLHRDWSESLGTGAAIGAANYPAKFSLHIDTANCDSDTTPDYVVFSSGLPGSDTQASIAGWDNLYSGCTGTVPSMYWAYNTGGQILTSPVVSLDGTQISFVQTDGVGGGTVVVLKWTAAPGDSVGAPETVASSGSYPSCTAPCMATFSLRDGLGVVTDDTTSSVFYDYGNDIAWVGDSRGWVHKFTPFFNGTPAEVRDDTWPVHVNANSPLTSVVHDQASGNLFTGDAGGIEYRVDSTTGAVTASAQLDFGTGLVEGPVVDSSNGLVYVFASSDGTANCGASFTLACSAVYQLTTSFAAGDPGSEVTVGDSVAFGSLPNPNPMYIGGFDSTYYESGNATGNLYVCGNTGGSATLYQVPILAGAFPGTGLGLKLTQLAGNTSTAPCSPVTDAPNPNATGGSAERLFVSVQNDGLPTNCASGGCILNFVDTPWQPLTSYSVGQQVFNSKLRIVVAITAGTSAAAPPNWTTSAGTTNTDGSVVWLSQGALPAAPYAGWAALHAYSFATDKILDSNGNVEVSHTVGVSGASTPTWNTTPGGTTADGTVVWINAGALPTSAMAAAGGTSGIIIDNVVSSGILTGASQVYFSTLSDQTCGTSGTGGCAVQASQSALQ
jgi:hypothetical protein